MQIKKEELVGRQGVMILIIIEDIQVFLTEINIKLMFNGIELEFKHDSFFIFFGAK